MNYSKWFTGIISLLSMLNVPVVRSGLRIIGGRNDTKDEFPYVVRIEVIPANVTLRRQRRDSQILCSASVLTAVWTLTSAHCIRFLEKHEAKHPGVKYKNMIRIKGIGDQPSSGGDFKRNDINPPLNDELFEIISYYKHPAFRGLIMDNIILIDNDIGLLNTESIPLKQYAKVSAVDYGTVTGQMVTAVGYGVSVIIGKKNKDAPPLPRPLKVLDLVVVNCPKLWHLYPAICVAQPCGRRDTMCAGDSGGPLMHPSGIIAITSVYDSRDCTVGAQERSYIIGVFTATNPYVDWITSHVFSGH